MSALRIILSKNAPNDCAAFFDALANQATTGKGDPRSTLLKRLAAARRAAEHLSAEAQLQMVVRAWNAWRKGEELHVLRVRAAAGAPGQSVVVQIPKAV